MEIKIVCSECGEEMDYQVAPIGPGFNGPVVKIEPCCGGWGTTIGKLKELHAAINDIKTEVEERNG